MKASPAEVDVAYWAKMSFWTIEQSTSLLIGADPDVMLDGSSLTANCTPESRVAYFRMFRLLDSHIRVSGIGFSQPPTEIIEWALHAKVDPPQALVEAVRAQGRTLIETRTAARVKAESAALIQDKPLGERERNTLLRIIIGMAVRGYGYDPDAARSDIPKTIADDLSGLGLECSDQTVREKLKDARGLLPGDWKARGDAKPN
jgi:hypothetical protein